MRLRTDLVLRHLGDEHVLIDPGQDIMDISRVYTLNDTAAFLWKALEGKEFTAETVTIVLLKNYDIEASSVLEEDVNDLVSDFERHGLLAP